MKTIAAVSEAPVAVIESAYQIKMSEEALAKLKDIPEMTAYAQEQTALAAAIAVTDETSYEVGAAALVNLTKTRKGLEELQAFFSKPLEATKKKVIATFKALGEEALKQEDRLREETGAYWMKRENDRRAAESRRQADAAAAERKARMLGRAAPAPVTAPAVVETPKTTATENGGLTIKTVWVGEVVDAAAVPEKYWVIDQKRIDADVKAGERSIPGVAITEKPMAAVR